METPFGSEKLSMGELAAQYPPNLILSRLSFYPFFFIISRPGQAKILYNIILARHGMKYNTLCIVEIKSHLFLASILSIQLKKVKIKKVKS